jgi:hypothetical protein
MVVGEPLVKHDAVAQSDLLFELTEFLFVVFHVISPSRFS